MPATDFQLLQQFADDRNESAFAQLVERHAGMVRGVCQRVLRDPAGADDAFQSTWISLARHARSLCETEQQTDSLSSWLYRVAVNACLQNKRKSESRRRTELAFAERQTSLQNEQRQREEWLPILDEEIGALPARFQSPLVLCHLQGRTQQDAAAELGLTYATIRRRLQKARELLKLRLVRRGFNDAGVMAIPLLGIAAEMTLQATPTTTAINAVCAQALSATGTQATAVTATTAVASTQTGLLTSGKWVVASCTLASMITVGAFAWTFNWLHAAESVVTAHTPGDKLATTKSTDSKNPTSSTTDESNPTPNTTAETPSELADAGGTPLMFDSAREPSGPEDFAIDTTETIELAEQHETNIAVDLHPDSLASGQQQPELSLVGFQPPGDPPTGHIAATAKPAAESALPPLPDFHASVSPGSAKGKPAPADEIQRLMQALDAQRDALRDRRRELLTSRGLGRTPTPQPPESTIKGSITLGDQSRRFFTAEQAAELAKWLKTQTLPENAPLRIVVNIDGVVEKYHTVAAAVPILESARFPKQQP